MLEKIDLSFILNNTQTHTHTHTNTNKAQYSQIIIKSDYVVPLTLNIHSNTFNKIKDCYY